MLEPHHVSFARPCQRYQLASVQTHRYTPSKHVNAAIGNWNSAQPEDVIVGVERGSVSCARTAQQSGHNDKPLAHVHAI